MMPAARSSGRSDTVVSPNVSGVKVTIMLDQCSVD